MARELCRSNQHVQNSALRADIGHSAHPSGSKGLRVHNTFFACMKTKLEHCCSQNRHQQHYRCYLLEGSLSSFVQGLQRLPKAKQWKPEALQPAVPWPVASQLFRNTGVRRRTLGPNAKTLNKNAFTTKKYDKLSNGLFCKSLQIKAKPSSCVL